MRTLLQIIYRPFYRKRVEKENKGGHHRAKGDHRTQITALTSARAAQLKTTNVRVLRQGHMLLHCGGGTVTKRHHATPTPLPPPN